MFLYRRNSLLQQPKVERTECIASEVAPRRLRNSHRQGMLSAEDLHLRAELRGHEEDVRTALNLHTQHAIDLR